MQLLAMSGSLRAESRNMHVLLAAARLVPADVTVTLYREFDELPHFNPDVEERGAPPPVAALRERLAVADAVLVCSPEYAHGIPGSFKNCLDWLVGVGLGRRPVGVVNASPASTHAHAALCEVLRTMDGELLPAATIALQTRDRGPDELAADAALADCIAALVAAGRAWRAATEE